VVCLSRLDIQTNFLLAERFDRSSIGNLKTRPDLMPLPLSDGRQLKAILGFPEHISGRKEPKLVWDTGPFYCQIRDDLVIFQLHWPKRNQMTAKTTMVLMQPPPSFLAP